VFPSLTVWENLAVAQQRESTPAHHGMSTGSTPCSRGCANATRNMPAHSRRRTADACDRARADGQSTVLLLDEPSEGLAPLIVAEVGAPSDD